ncbi:hypothetical protein IF1G_07024 [Cordyceps javanica]|uniref:PD-(D/E)XK nuclease-like domain-containing protein n=1 Tax=Cordyceps javanica TaxID=43265 RepID=A0A545VWC3_9HYPO|nr:hypothetical protein IF1G_07024 [Cordyceps javanica]TQW06022.1 hypothetical protein IF2G_06305 [Cordyceps javanica]
MQLERIQRWIAATIQADDESLTAKAPAARGVKRRRFDPISTPPLSDTFLDCGDNCMDETPTPAGEASPSSSSSKRRLDDETPRAKRIMTSRSERSYVSLSSASSNRSGRTGGGSSPRKQLRSLQLNPRGLDVRSLFDAHAALFRPAALQRLLDDVQEIADGRGIVAREVQPSLERAAAWDVRFSWALRHGGVHIVGDDGASDLRGRSPPPAAVRRVLKAALECDDRGHPEANWNTHVHSRILEMAFRPYNEDEEEERVAVVTKKENLVDFMASTTASIIAEYGIPTVSKKVDFCVFIDPIGDRSLPPTFQAGVEHARAALPLGIVSFTDFAPLYDRFVALSIETKKPSENLEAAELQLGVWDMARWSLLRRLVELRLLSATTTTTTDQDVDEAAASLDKETVQAQLPEFLPGIIVQGHDWLLVVTTIEGEKTVLWQKLMIGSTATARGVYQIVRTLQLLETWTREMHWPWLRGVVEGIAGAQA